MRLLIKRRYLRLLIFDLTTSMSDAESVQQELQAYLQAKGINSLFISMVESLLLTKPDNPIAHIIEYLQTHFPEKAQFLQRKPSYVGQSSDVDDAKELRHGNPGESPECDTNSMGLMMYVFLS